MPRTLKLAFPTLALLLALLSADAQQKSYRLPSVSLKPQVIWGATCDGPDGTGLAFGGQDQKADDGQPHTRIKVDGKWVDIYEELKKNNPLQKHYEQARKLSTRMKALQALVRTIYFKGLTKEEELKSLDAELAGPLKEWTTEQEAFADHLWKLDKQAEGPAANSARILLVAGVIEGRDLVKNLPKKGLGTTYSQLDRFLRTMELIADSFGPEPPPRALSPIVYESKTKLFVMFGGDHLDYLMNDFWAFDPAKKNGRGLGPTRLHSRGPTTR
ncbi:MAG: DUF4962 domain-containing protein [Gemmataceae bacterium]|nr:DUF4962 domain-containing protein [Gemmataceae bacterium]